MIRLQKTTEEQNIDFIPRSYIENASYTFKITSQEESEEVYSQTTTDLNKVDYYYRVSDVFSLEEGSTYVFKVYLDTLTVYQDVIFCSNQTSTPYSINKDQYTYKTNDTSEDNFVMYE